MDNNCKQSSTVYTINNACYIVERSFGTSVTIQDLIKEIITSKEMRSKHCIDEESCDIIQTR